MKSASERDLPGFPEISRDLARFGEMDIAGKNRVHLAKSRLASRENAAWRACPRASAFVGLWRVESARPARTRRICAESGNPRTRWATCYRTDVAGTTWPRQ